MKIQLNCHIFVYSDGNLFFFHKFHFAIIRLFLKTIKHKLLVFVHNMVNIFIIISIHMHFAVLWHGEIELWRLLVNWIILGIPWENDQ